jgi:pimeloyl-ACP methyl ester carboxylesterase
LNTSNATTTAIPHRSMGQGEPALLFIHGFMDAGAVWDPVISALDVDVQKITIDLPGMGALHSDDGEISLARYAADVSGLINYLARPVIIVAQSMGAQIAELVALANPSRVKGLVLLTPVPLAGVNAPPEAVAPFRQIGGEAALQRQARRNLSYALSSEAEALLGGLGDVVKPATVSALVDAWNNGDPAGIVASTFTGPVLIIRGAADPFVTEEMAGSIAGRFAHAQSETVAEAGHWVHVEQPTRVAALIGQYVRTIEGRSIAEQGASDWTGAFAKRSATAFADAFAEDVVLEASVLFQPVGGRENVKRVMEAASKIYESLEFTEQSAAGLRQYLEWKASAFGGVSIDGVTVITRSEDGSISRVAIHHRPLGAALQFSAAIGDRLRGIIDAVHFLTVKDLPHQNRS